MSDEPNSMRSDLPTQVEDDHILLPTPVQATQETFQTIHNTFVDDHSQIYTHRHPHRPTSSILVTPRGEDIAPKPLSYDHFRFELKRLETFSDWPRNAPVSKDDLARNGFIYLHTKDRTMCVFCRGILSSWEQGDVVADEHKKHCPDCPFAFGYRTNNVTIDEQRQAQQGVCQPTVASSQPKVPTTIYNTLLKIPVPAQNTAQHVTHNVPETSGHFSNRFESRVAQPSSGSFANQFDSLPTLPSWQQGGNSSMTQLPTIEPKYKDWADERVRIRSFSGWPSQMNQKPRDLANAGLLYMGSGDRCKCHWCGGELYEWEELDEPWEEHAKWFPHCNYVRTNKGENFIKYVKDKQNGLIVDPPAAITSNPHVLAVLQNGYTKEQVMEAFSRFDAANLVDARAIVQAIDRIKEERIAMRNQCNVSTPQSNDDDIELMESEDYPPESNMAQSTSSVSEKKEAVKQSTSSADKDTGSRPSSSASTEKADKDSDALEKLKDQTLCKICLDNELSITFLPCGHLATCEDCSKTLNLCPICRKPITQKLKVFWS